jgi:hypothetical protein
LTYYVLLFEKENNALPKEFLHIAKYDQELLLLEDSFSIFFDKKLLFFQKHNGDIDIAEIRYFAKNSFDLYDLKVIEKINIQNDAKNDYKFFKTEKNKLFNIYIVYLVILIFIAFSFISSNGKKEDLEPIKQINESIKTIKNETRFPYLSSFLLSFYKELNDKDIRLDFFVFENSLVKIVLSSKSKKNIYEVLKKYRSDIENISFDKKKKEYIANANFKISRNKVQ